MVLEEMLRFSLILLFILFYFILLFFYFFIFSVHRSLLEVVVDQCHDVFTLVNFVL